MTVLAFKESARVKETTTTTGTGELTPAGAVAGYETFTSNAATGDVFRYVILAANGTDWEYGIGTWDGSHVERTTVLKSTNSDNAISLAAGTHTVFIDEWPGICVLGNYSAGGLWTGEAIGPGSAFANTGGEDNTKGLYAPCSGYLFRLSARRRITTTSLTFEVYVNNSATGMDLTLGTGAEDVTVENTTEHVAVTVHHRIAIRNTHGASAGTSMAPTASMFFAPGI